MSDKLYCYVCGEDGTARLIADLHWHGFGVHIDCLASLRARLADEQAGNPNNCETCRHKPNGEGGWCYMFRNEPTETCMQHTERVRRFPLSAPKTRGSAL